mmetsp:Transcript_2414/g.5241  ORF Transcript_2414/g.5241 Transcript_2414/m.5241 type:complete len:210 (-) Transcript_2414:122-751(-)|eukprot:CAMPEP_0168193298 /NCGR_PEP_ID=MMETSP0139_2-20121125/18530_1 /TAXON_ID=44445 /ORGANISM="Pseudo-nitzschia australis, Strain 10249 10 AB" /LENGTH=209 /DNA_ID=CAMNT_0008116641 /DNA_START=83 /DNA_END=712 /DNA_ORIENTATION=+
MTRLLSFLPILISFPFAASAENDGAIAIEKTAIELKYAVDVYECDDDGYELKEPREKKIASVYRICFEPNRVARDAGVSIKNIDSWTWSTTRKDGDPPVQEAVIDGKAVGGLNILMCLDDEGGKCILDTFLGVDFYDNTFGVEGYGEASMTVGTGTVPVERDLFQSKFSVRWEPGAFETLQELELEKQKAKELNASIEAKSAEDLKEEL